MLVDPTNVSDEVTTTVIPTDTPDKLADSPQAADDGVPEKFKGKTAKEIAEAYQNLETELGRARNEIGTNRRLVDELLNLRRQPEAKSEPASSARPVTPMELAENPEETITGVAKRVADERTAQAEERIAAVENSLAARDFEARHPGWKDLPKNAEFVQWVQGSPTRIKLVQKAAQNDWDAGDELLGLYNEHKALRKSTTTTTTNPTEEARKASLAASGGSGANKVVEGGDGKKIWKREELARLYSQNPQEYDRLYPEIHKAYLEKRVR